MPELAEVEYYRRRWDPGLGRRVTRVGLHPGARTFRDCDPRAVAEALTGALLKSSAAHGKQMLFRFSGGAWLGVHLGMSGELLVVPPGEGPGKHDHLVLVQAKRSLVFRDPRMFGGVRFHRGRAFDPPPWWRDLPPDLLSDAFDRDALGTFLQRRKRSPVKAVLLMQERFPGLGNWMADEILWRAAIHPARPAGEVTGRDLGRLYHSIREVCQDALDVIAPDWGDPPETWLFPHRWKDGGRCPKTRRPLQRITVAGRTTCFSPARQKR